MDFKRAPLRDVLRMIAESGNVERMNVVVPQTLDRDVTISVANAPWEHVFEAVLVANGLWYTYRPDGRLIAVVPRHDEH